MFFDNNHVDCQLSEQYYQTFKAVVRLLAKAQTCINHQGYNRAVGDL